MRWEIQTLFVLRSPVVKNTVRLMSAIICFIVEHTQTASAFSSLAKTIVHGRYPSRRFALGSRNVLVHDMPHRRTPNVRRPVSVGMGTAVVLGECGNIHSMVTHRPSPPHLFTAGGSSSQFWRTICAYSFSFVDSTKRVRFVWK